MITYFTFSYINPGNALVLHTKVFDLTEDEHVHANVLLEKLPDKKYSNVDEVLGDLQQVCSGMFLFKKTF